MRTESEARFEDYLKSFGYDVTYEPFGTNTNPDFVFNRSGNSCYAEVKEFKSKSFFEWQLQNPRKLGRPLHFLLRPVRNAFRSASHQLEPFSQDGIPLLIVVSNPHGAGVNLSDKFVLSALFGDLKTLVSNDDQGNVIFKEYFDSSTMDPAVFGHVSAVVVLRQSDRKEIQSMKFLRDLEENEPALTAHEKSQRIRSFEATLKSQPIYTVTVIKLNGTNATPLPAGFLSDNLDSEWTSAGSQIIKSL